MRKQSLGVWLYADDLKNTPAPAELLYSLEQAASGIGFYVNSDITEFMF